jgi:hypothetical protein
VGFRFRLYLETVKAALRFFFLSLWAFCVPAQQNDWLVVPGERLGPISSTVTRAGLERLLGKANIRDQKVDSGEGQEPATVVFPEKPGATLAIFWRDSGAIRDVIMCYQRDDHFCKWHTKEGVSLGTSLEQLEKLNGRPFEFTPWGSDVGGNIVSWQGGRLAGVLGEGVNNRLWLTLDFPVSSHGFTRKQRSLLDEIDALKRGPLSSDLAVRQLQPVVSGMRLVVMRKMEP